jgi:hypothetical protein
MDRKSLIGIVICILLLLPAFSTPAAAESDTKLSLEIFGGLPLPGFIHTVGGVIVNIGDTSAYNVSYTLTITGGFNGDINKSASDNWIELSPGLGIAFGIMGTYGFGPVIITLTASALNAETATRTVRGFQMRGFTWVPLSWIIPPLFQHLIPWLNLHPAQEPYDIGI